MRKINWSGSAKDPRENGAGGANYQGFLFSCDTGNGYACIGAEHIYISLKSVDGSHLVLCSDIYIRVYTMGIYTPVAFLFSALTYVVTLPLDVGKEGYKTQLINTACQLEINQTLKAAFQADVRQRYAGTDNLNTLTSENWLQVTAVIKIKIYKYIPLGSIMIGQISSSWRAVM